MAVYHRQHPSCSPNAMAYPNTPPPPYSAIAGPPPLPRRPIQAGPPIPDLKQEARQRKSSHQKKKSARSDQDRKKPKSHCHGPYSHSNLSFSRPSGFSNTTLSLAPPPSVSQTQLPMRPAVPQIPRAVPPTNNSTSCLDSQILACLTEGTAFYNDMCQNLDNLTQQLDRIPRCSQRRDRLPENTYAHYGTAALAPEQSSNVTKDRAIINTAASKENVSSKVYQYANSRLPSNLMPFRAYMDTWRLLSIAARHADSVYSKPTANERETHINADWRHGTKAMVLKSVPVDNQNTLVFAIRGSQSFTDWAVNFQDAPSSPAGFLDDAGNMCHAGFLSTAKSMVKPVAARLRTLLEQDPSRCNSSLLITGHSAGGAVAALLFAHMLSQTVESELSILTPVFRRVHCVTFGAPPVSLLPLAKPPDPRYAKFLFFGLVNQGDPVTRASKDYVASLARLYVSSVPAGSTSTATGQQQQQQQQRPKKDNKCVKGLLKAAKSLNNLKGEFCPKDPAVRRKPVWAVPPAAASNAGRLVLLRERAGAGSGSVEACAVTDEQLREVVFGDPAMHSMTLYARRVEQLAFWAVTGREG